MNKRSKQHLNFKLVTHSARTGFKTVGAKVQVTCHRSLLHQYRKHPKHSQKPTLGLKTSVWAKSGLRLASMNVQDTLRIGKTMTCDLYLSPVALRL